MEKTVVKPVENIINNLYRIRVPLPDNPLRELNSYLFLGKERSLLIDTGFRQKECRDALICGLNALHVSLDRLDVLGTHLHSDHIGLAGELTQKNGGVVYLGAKDYDILTGPERNTYWERMDARYLSEGFSAEGLKILETENPARNLGPLKDYSNYRPVREGDRIPAGEYTLTVVETPGHTPGQICLWMEQGQIMFTADHILFDITPNIMQWTQTEDALGDYLESLKKVYTYDVHLALPGHREVGPYHKRIEELLHHHQVRVEECRRIVCQEPGLTATEISGRMAWNIRARNWAEFPLVQKWFAVGEGIAHLDYLRQRALVTREMSNGIYHYFPA